MRTRGRKVEITHEDRLAVCDPRINLVYISTSVLHGILYLERNESEVVICTLLFIVTSSRTGACTNEQFLQCPFGRQEVAVYGREMLHPFLTNEVLLFI